MPQLLIHAPLRQHLPRLATGHQYCVSRGADTGPIGENFGVICDQIDRAHVMLTDPRERIRNGLDPAARPNVG